MSEQRGAQEERDLIVLGVIELGRGGNIGKIDQIIKLFFFFTMGRRDDDDNYATTATVGSTVCIQGRCIAGYAHWTAVAIQAQDGGEGRVSGWRCIRQWSVRDRRRQGVPTVHFHIQGQGDDTSPKRDGGGR